MNFLKIAGALLLITLVIARQTRGEPLRGRRLIVLPVAVTILGIYLLARHDTKPTATDLVCIGVSALVAAAIGVGQGATTVLESHDGVLWGRMPLQGLWLWALLIVSRLVMTGVAAVLHAHVAASASPILLVLGVNRIGQAIVVAPRALNSGISLAPERDGRPFLRSTTNTWGPSEPYVRGQSVPPGPGWSTGGNPMVDRFAGAQERLARRRERRYHRRR
ncbi:hypothetical protein AB0M68_37795 [Streptomyces sp. NPDC051453]|uniref:hypothetical protein n=1 Tax=Streptomyces sp. NPDC051453 TaxID=3154941 RepID=UPI003418E8E6